MDKSYWRGFVDAQQKFDYATKLPMAQSTRKRTLKPLAELTGLPIVQYRSGYCIVFPDLDKKLGIKKKNANYIRGAFAAQGQIYHGPLKITLSSKIADEITQLLENHLKMIMPKVQRPAAHLPTLRLTVTGPKAEAVQAFLKHQS